ncbi:MAG: hypothetical protein J2P53_15315 [Bradyrhizobiaceae bacterium]|nr:hypothetical protein [Bradyrhizobiaceae bacterium]
MKETPAAILADDAGLRCDAQIQVQVWTVAASTRTTMPDGGGHRGRRAKGVEVPSFNETIGQGTIGQNRAGAIR